MYLCFSYKKKSPKMSTLNQRHLLKLIIALNNLIVDYSLRIMACNFAVLNDNFILTSELVSFEISTFRSHHTRNFFFVDNVKTSNYFLGLS